MFEFGQDFSYLLINGSPPSNLLQQALIRAQKWPFEQEGNFPSAFEPVTQLQQSGTNMHEFYRLLEIFFNCVLRARGKFDAPQEGIGASNRIVWPPNSQAIPQPAISAPGSSSKLSPAPPSVPLSRKSVPTDEKRRDQAEETVNQREFTTPALNSLIEMTLSKTYQLGGANELAKGKSGQKHINGASMTGEVNSADGLSSRTPKRRKTRTTFTSFQLAELEVYFSKQKYLTPADRDQIAGELGLSSTQVITWFQNRRAKKKRECAELERDLMAAKRSCEKESAFSFDAVHSSQVASLSSSSAATASTTAEETVAAANAVHPPFSPASCSCSSSSSASVSASASLTEGPTVSAPPGKPDFSIPSLTAPDSSRCRNPKPIWRPVCLEDIGRE